VLNRTQSEATFAYRSILGTMPQANTGRESTADDVQQLRGLADTNTPVGVISMRLGCGEDAIRSKAVRRHLAATGGPLAVPRHELTAGRMLVDGRRAVTGRCR
jgi:hypothetical protein